jgi:methylmalonyl-CoA mutase cobalamin-binding subunit
MNRQQLYTLGAILLASLSLDACAPTGGVQTPSAQTQAVVENGVSIACIGIDVASSMFDVYAKQHPDKIDAAGVKWKGGVVAGIKPICDNPTGIADPKQAIAKLTAVALSIRDYLSGSGASP